MKNAPMMERRHYEFIARIRITHRDAFGRKRLERVAQDFADELQGDNPRFDRARFLRACGVEA